MNIEEVIRIQNDINEIDDIVYETNGFDRTKAISVIQKHNMTNFEVAIMNHPLRSGYTTFDCATNEMLANNLLGIKQILMAKLKAESLNQIFK